MEKKEISSEEQNKRQTRAAKQFEADGITPELAPGYIDPTLIDAELTDEMHVGKIPQERDKPREMERAKVGQPEGDGDPTIVPLDPTGQGTTDEVVLEGATGGSVTAPKTHSQHVADAVSEHGEKGSSATEKAGEKKSKAASK